MALIASYGGGVNSTAMLVWMVKNKLVVHHILFADTGGEKPETYSYVKMFSDWLVDNAYPEIITVKYATKNSNELTLEQDVLNRKALPSIAYGWKTCSDKFKRRPINKWIKEHLLIENPHQFIYMYLAFDANEERRRKDNTEKGF